MEACAPDAIEEATDSRRGAASRLADQVRERSGQLADFGLAKAAEFAEAKKLGVAGKLDAVTEIVRDLADAAGERFGASVGDLVHGGGDALEMASRKLQARRVEDVIGTARSAVVRYPAVALAAVSVAGFLAGRILKAGLGQSSGQRSYHTGANAAEAGA